MKTSPLTTLRNSFASTVLGRKWSQYIFSTAGPRAKTPFCHPIAGQNLRRRATSGVLALAISAAWSAGVARAADKFWSGGTASYAIATNWTGGVIPGSGDHAINNSGSTNVVQINGGDPAWALVDLIAGNSDNTSGAYIQNGSTVTVGATGGWLRLGVNNGSFGIYTLNSGTLINGDQLHVGENGTATMNINGGTITKSGGQFSLSDSGNAGASGLVNQTSGTIDSTSELWVGNNIGTGVYNLSGGIINLHNWFAMGRGSANGTFVMTGGTFNMDGNGHFLVGTGNGSVALFQHSAGSVNVQKEVRIPDGGAASGTYNMSGTATLTVNNWLAVGRNGGTGIMNLTNGTVTKTGNGNIVVGSGGGGSGTLNQYGGTIINTANPNSLTYLGESGGNGTWNLNGGTASLGILQFCQNISAVGTLNLNGGLVSASEVNCGAVGGFSTLNFNGGTLQATGDNANFVHDLAVAYVSPGGAVFDSQAFNITVSQTLTDNGGGGLAKNGAGTLTLTGGNNYSGPTLVNAGTLAVNSDSGASGSYTVASGAKLSIKPQSPNAQFNAANLTCTSPAAALSFELGAFGNPNLAPLNVVGTLDVNGTVTINVTDSLPQIGQFPLIKYGTKTGAGSFVVGSVPVGSVATIVNNVGNNSIDLNISSVNLPRWEGLAGGNWDIGLTTNWVNVGNGLATFYGEGNAIIFNDSATGSTAVNLVTTVNPSSVTIDNSSLPYTLNGTGKISGNTGLSKQGTGTFTVANTGGNNYSGPTVISGGVLSVTNLANGGSPSAIGASSANATNLALATGTLRYAGPAVSINRGYSIQGVTSYIDAQGNLTLSGLAKASSGSGFSKIGPALLAYTGAGTNALSGVGSSAGYRVEEGTVRLDGTSGGQTNVVEGHFGVGGLGGVNAALILTNTTLNILSGGMDLGRSGGATGTMTLNTGSVLNKSGGTDLALGDGGGQPSFGVVNHLGGTLNSDSEVWVGQDVSGVGNYNLSGGALNMHNWLAVGRRGGNGTFSLTGGTLTKDGNGNLVVGTGGAGSVGVFEQSGGTVNCQNEYWMAENGGTEATNNISGTAVLNLNSWMSIGRGGHAVINFSGGTITKTGGGNFIIGDGGNGYVKQTAGTLNINSDIWIGQSGSGTGQFDLSGTGTVSNNGWLAVGREGGTGTLNINGGLLTKAGGGNTSIAHGGGTGTVNVNSGSIDTSSGETWIGEDSNAGVWNNNGGTATVAYVQLSRNSSAPGSLNLNGGTFTANEITTGSGGTSTLNFNGGTLGAGASTANFLHGLTAANVLSGGAVINSGTNVIGITQSFLDGGAGGGLTKIGNGTLYLNGVNTYTGSTLASFGILGGSGTIAGPVTVASGAKLAPGVSLGTLTVNNTLTLAAGSTTLIDVSLDGGVTNSDLVTGLTGITYGGSLVVTNAGTNALVAGTVFKLFNSAAPRSGNFSAITILPAGTGSFNPATGELTIVTVGAPTLNPPTVSGGNLILTGTGGVAGSAYTWLTSTNAAAPMAAWTTNTTGVFSGGGSFSNAVPINASEPARFFRLRTP